MGFTPNWSLWLNTTWGFPDDVIFGNLFGANNVVLGTNPPFTLQTFFSLYPKFGGATLAQTGGTTLGSAVVTIPSTTGMAKGNPIAGDGIPDGALIKSVDSSGQVTLNVNATATATGVPLTVWNACPYPILLVAAYLALANASLVERRWLEQWPLGMCLYVAHFLTLYARSDGNPLSGIGQIAAQGISTGIQVAKAVGDVSVSYQPVTGLEDWGAWNLTTYGQELATFAKIVGAGSALYW